MNTNKETKEVINETKEYRVEGKVDKGSGLRYNIRDFVFTCFTVIIILSLSVALISYFSNLAISYFGSNEVVELVNRPIDEEVNLTVTGKGEIQLKEGGRSYKYIELTRMNKETEKRVAIFLDNSVSGSKVITYDIVVSDSDYDRLDEWSLVGSRTLTELNDNVMEELGKDKIEEIKEVIAGTVK